MGNNSKVEGTYCNNCKKMNKGHIGISQETLISDSEAPTVSSRRLYQYIASVASTLGALSCGMALAWSSSAGGDGKLLQSLYGIEISSNQFSWISSLVAVGAGAICVPIGLLADLIGRKCSMLLMVIPFIIGWLLIIFANSVVMFYFGRFITGLGSGAFCIAAPIYIAEIAENDIRGRLGSYFQLLFTVGVLLSYILGTVVNIRELSIISAVIPVVFFAIFMFMPETPTYYLKKGDEDAARQSLIKFRGTQYNIEDELQCRKHALEENSSINNPFVTLLKSKATLHGFVISYGLMLLQQFCGINAVIFYADSIFEKAGSNLDSKSSTIIVGVIQVLAVYVSTIIVDRAGRRILLLTSAIFMCISSCALGTYFYLAHTEQDVSGIKWLPLTSVCVFIIMYSIGFGPLPWMMLGEIFAPEVKGLAASSAGLLNWISVFIVTKFFNVLPTFAAFWLFSALCAIGTFFVYFLVLETKAKSLEQIQRELNGL